MADRTIPSSEQLVRSRRALVSELVTALVQSQVAGDEELNFGQATHFVCREIGAANRRDGAFILRALQLEAAREGLSAAKVAALAVERWKQYIDPAVQRPWYPAPGLFFRDGLWMRPHTWRVSHCGAAGDSVAAAIETVKIRDVQQDASSGSLAGIGGDVLKVPVDDTALPVAIAGIAGKANLVANRRDEVSEGTGRSLTERVMAQCVKEVKNGAHGFQSTEPVEQVLRSRRALVSELVMAVREFATPRLHVTEVHELDSLVTCCECLFGWTQGHPARHREGCRVGQALLLAEQAEALLRADEAAAAESLQERDTREAGGAGGGLAAEKNGFGEPWAVDPEHPTTAVDTFGALVLDMAGTDLGERAGAAACARIVRCVNFCEGVPTRGLYAVPQASGVAK